ncbi:LodA/GoxA family CTQ-dependent oxidase [Streptomyces sp. NPDC096339]|uniref:LodA/GoxA family CTQ-dependent oxidase n=1 Tax=Streptomyces sp. NPDC096339 TaxID=3366086 RepID=UPI00382B7380
MNIDEIVYCEIHPTLGVARVGNSPGSFYVGPEAPGVAVHPAGGFKDPEGRVKRQAARFRVYAYDKDHKVLGEVTAAEAEVRWTVELANAKADWFKFNGRLNQSDLPANRRNAMIDPADPQARAGLVIKPGPRSVAGPDVDGSGSRFDTGTFLGTLVTLGELRTDEAGRLLVLGGHGRSASVKPHNPLVHYANNDHWFDDISDGPVTATVTVGGGRTIPVTPAWVIVAPPDFAPDVTSLVTLYDVAREVAERAGWLPAAEEVSFAGDIYPLLERMCGYRWVNGNALRGHGKGARGDFLNENRLARLASNAPADASFRNDVFTRLRTPGAHDVTQANYTFMPQLAGDGGDPVEGDPSRWMTILSGQYERMRRWAAGDFVADGVNAPAPAPAQLADLPVAEQPHALVRAALEACVGASFFPGIEMTFIADEPTTWSGSFRLREGLAAGDVTKYMALPWQADFYECNTHWWPAQRPDDVLPEREYQRLIQSAAESAGQLPEHQVHRQPWARGVGLQVVYKPELDRLPGESDAEYGERVYSLWTKARDHAGDNDMVDKWSTLGFVVARAGTAGETVLVETERAEQVGLSDREWFYVLQHPERFPEQAKAAKNYAQAVLDRAVSEQQTNPMLPLTLRPFRYSREALDSRLELIYAGLAMDGESADGGVTLFTRQMVIERLRQLAPFNLLDGAWLRNATQAGPTNEVHALLFAIWVDEMGNGNPALNHANLYSDLLHSVGVYLPPVDSYAFAMLPEMLDSAYTVGAFELAISQHSQEFLPELLGMTLYLEWEVLGLKPTVKLLEYHGIDPQFYAMHIGIDNATEGHGAKARDAVVQYLEEIYDNGGDTAVQQCWQRIWNGYVAFGNTGNLGDDLWELLFDPPTPEERLIRLIGDKAPFASRNHGAKTLGGTRLNDWFLDPSGLLQELQDSGLILPGDPEQSPFFELTTFTGPMYKVFTDAELDLWRQWTRSLTTPPTKPALSPLEAMTRLVDLLRSRQAGNSAHSNATITGPDPAEPGRTRTESVAWWFTQPAGALLAAIAHPNNGLVQPGQPQESVFVTDLISPSNGMGRAFDAVVPGTSRTGREIAVEWINAGCPLPDLTPPQARVMLSALTSPEVAEVGVGGISRPKIHGMGAVH